MSDVARNKQVVLDYYQTAFGGNPEKAVADHFGPRYIQHNPDAQDGPEAFIGFVRWLRGEYPNLKLDIKLVIAEGDLVVTHSHLDLEPGSPDNPGRALADYFRCRTARSSSTGMSFRTFHSSPPTPTACSDGRRARRPGSCGGQVRLQHVASATDDMDCGAALAARQWESCGSDAWSSR